MDTGKCILENRIKEIDLDSWQSLTNMLAKLYNASSGSIIQYREGQFKVIATSENDENYLEVGATWPWEYRSFCRQMIENGNPLYIADAANATEWQDAPAVSSGAVRSYFGHPIYWPNGELFGSICVIDTKPTEYKEDFLDLLGELKKLVEGHLQHAFDYQEIVYHALHDPLTGCANRLLMIDRLENQIGRAKRENKSFSILCLDLNQFKPVNDNYGHQAGDNVLQTTVSRIQNTIRETDLLARTGGDEFVIVFEGTVDATEFGEKLSRVITTPINWENKELRISASFGHAVYPDDATEVTALLNAADQAMYENKKS